MSSNYTVTDSLIGLLVGLASKQTAEEVAGDQGLDLDLFDLVDGIVYDAYMLGEEDGQILLARGVLAHLEGRQTVDSNQLS